MTQASAQFPFAADRRRIYWMRHGEVSYFGNSASDIREADATLNADGLAQAEAARLALADMAIDRVVTSGMPRSNATAEIVARGRELSIEARPALREIKPGAVSDLPLDQLPHVVTQAFTHGITADTRFLGGETFGSLASRVLPCLAELLADRTWRRLLVVAHGGVNRVVLAHALGSGLDGFGALEQDPACINVIDVEPDDRLLVRMVNFTSYNPLKNGLELTTMERLFVEYLRSAG